MRKHKELYGIPPEVIAKVCQVSNKTARRWKQEKFEPPKTALMILAADLGAFDPAWRGWRVNNGVLISPDGWEITMTDVLSAPLLRAQLEAYKAENRDLRTKWNAYDEQPMPGDIPQIKSVVA